jgi:hypothetical protein
VENPPPPPPRDIRQELIRGETHVKEGHCENKGTIKNKCKLKVFTTVPGSSINSWDSWFIFNLRKINTCYYMTHYTRKGIDKRIFAVASKFVHTLAV